MKIKMIFCYDGTSYFGYARQVNKISIQEVIEDKLKTIFQKDIKIYASGRTDKGVHALAQVADFIIDSNNIDLKKLKNRLNKLLPDDIEILSLEEVDESFSSRFSAIKKSYIYVINHAKPQPFLKKYSYFNDLLDIEIIKNASKKFIGKHDFKNFNSKPTDEDNFIREIYSIEINEKDGLYIIEIIGNGFMRYMVRKIVGTLIEIGLHKIDESFIDKYLDSPLPREIVNYTAQSQGLFLKEVYYK